MSEIASLYDFPFNLYEYPCDVYGKAVFLRASDPEANGGQDLSVLKVAEKKPVTG
jgi:hypothetical protein